MARDPVCGAEVDPQYAAARATYNGMTFYFDSLDCKEQFERSPAIYAQRAAAGEMAPTGEEGSHPEEFDVERHHHVVERGTDVIEGHGAETISKGADVIERPESGGAG